MSDTLDPDDWPAFRAEAHALLDAALDRLQGAGEGPVWQPLPDGIKARLRAPLPHDGGGDLDLLADILPYGPGNTHPRFFGWVHGAGTPTGLLADIAAAAMNANLCGRDHGAIYVEKQVVQWVREMFAFPPDSSGLIVSGTSMATLVALKTARDARLGFDCRKTGIPGAGLVGYTSAQSHSCLARTFDILGLGSEALRLIPVNDAFEMDTDALQKAIAADRAAGLTPFFIAGTAGTVNTGAIDDLDTLADIATREGLWLHVDGAFGATLVLSDHLRPRLLGIERADSVGFDFHKWLQVNYDAGFVLVRNGAQHLAAFTQTPEYLQEGRALAAGKPWPQEYGPELSRTNRALKIWAQFTRHGTGALAGVIERNVEQAQYLARLIEGAPDFHLSAPVSLNIVCFSHENPALNTDIVAELQLGGLAAPSTTVLGGQTVIRVNLTNHRTRLEDMDILLQGARDIAARLS